MIFHSIKRQLCILSGLSLGVMSYSQNRVLSEDFKALPNNTPPLSAIPTGNDGRLRIGDGGSIKVLSGALLKVRDAVTNVGTAEKFILETDAQLIQVNNVSNTGPLRAERTVTIRNQTDAVDYVYWSSPVAGQQTKGAGGFSPGTPSNRFYQYNESNDYFNQTPDLTFIPGKGYAVRAESGFVSPYTKTYIFRGTPHNGNIDMTINRSPNSSNGTVVHGYNMVGNPYPSNISFDQLFAANSALIYHTAWFWTNEVFVAVQQNNYTGNNYAVYNGTGGNNATTTSTKEAPDGIIKVGQGFIVQKKEEGAGNLNFKNSYGEGKDLRVSNPGQLFYLKGADSKNRYSLQLNSPDNFVNTQLIGYVAGATDDFEQDYDAEAFSLTSNLFYSTVEGKRLLIQGRSESFNVEDKVKLGVNFFQRGNYSITLAAKEGIFANGQNIFLKDLQNGIITNLSQGDYLFSADSGETNSRFEIIYRPETVLATDGADTKDGVVVYRENSDFIVKSPKVIERIEVYETSGKLIKILQPNKLNATIEAVGLPNGMYIVRIISKDGAVFTKKILR